MQRDTIAPLGRVATGVAVRAGEPLPDIADGAALARALRAATGILFPDPARATAGIHFANVLKRLGVYAEVEARLATFPNGATAMRELAQAARPGLLGCTQITEIKYTPGVTLVGPLPGDYALSTVYSVAVCTRARSRKSRNCSPNCWPGRRRRDCARRADSRRESQRPPQG